MTSAPFVVLHDGVQLLLLADAGQSQAIPQRLQAQLFGSIRRIQAQLVQGVLDLAGLLLLLLLDGSPRGFRHLRSGRVAEKVETGQRRGSVARIG